VNNVRRDRNDNAVSDLKVSVVQTLTNCGSHYRASRTSGGIALSGSDICLSRRRSKFRARHQHT
jgi:hypothetical protein